jgi:hypothetical protein
MRPDLLALPLQVGTLLIGPVHNIARIAGETATDLSFSGTSLRDLLARADPWRLRNVAAVWSVGEFASLQRTEQRLSDQVARMLETGRLTARFLPLFRGDPRVPNGMGPLRLYQLGGGPPPAPAAALGRSDSVPPPQRTQVRSPAETQKDFEDEERQIAVLRAAAKDGTPFCEQCARAAIRRARAVRDAA